MARYQGKNIRLFKPDYSNSKSNLGKSDFRGINIDLGWISRIFNGIIDIFSSFFYRRKERDALIIGLIVGIIISFFVILIIDFYKVKGLVDFKPNVATQLYDKNGVLIAELFRQKREVVPLKKIPRNLINATIAMEDNEFYDHWGINPKGIIRAFFINVFSGRIKQGGSTITQQLAKVLLTSQKRNIFRKIKEAFIAVMIEMIYSKEEILGMYFNQIFLGHGSYGVESASQLYFKKHVSELNLAECALLATLPAAPNLFSPIRYPNFAMQRHKIALVKMVEMGFLKKETAEKAYLKFWPDYLYFISDIPPTVSAFSSRLDKAPWFSEYVRRYLVRKYGEHIVYDEGLLVYTTLDVKKQIVGQKVLKRVLREQSGVSTNLSFKNDEIIQEKYYPVIELFSDLFGIESFKRKGSRDIERINNFYKRNLADEFEYLNLLTGLESIDKFLDGYKKSYFQDKEFQNVEGCIISINQTNGYIEAMIGGSEFTSSNQLNRPMQALRQPGSSIKPLLYSAAIESKKFTPATTVLDSPIIYLDNEGGDWLPENYEGEYYGFVRLREALMKSINVVSVRIAQEIGIETVMKYYTKLLGFDSSMAKRRISRNLSIALGSIEVSPYELTRAYAIIANGGKEVMPFSIRYIKDRYGKMLENKEEEIQKKIKDRSDDGSIQIIKPDTSQIMISMMQSVIGGGTGGAASCGRPAGGKTGTTSNWKDAWFIGFTPQLTTGIWIGYDKLGLSLGSGQTGGGIAAPLFGEFMRDAMADEPVLDFPVYAPVSGTVVCKRSGFLPSSYCRETIDEIFIPGTIPDKTCDMCENYNFDNQMVKKGPQENISEKQKASIINNLKKDSGNSILENVGDDLLNK